ncbi:MAG: S9 family peptidase [Blastocatellia bacterium]|nr:MAG: S9 family peptidase [Blastocatellia bacterium]
MYVYVTYSSDVAKWWHYNPAMRILSIAPALIGLLWAGPALAAGRPITAADLLTFQRVSEPQLSPDGSRVVYTLAIPDLSANRLVRNVWIASRPSGEARAVTTTGKDFGAKWSPDGHRLAFVSSRAGSAQLYVVDADGTGEPLKLTSLSGGVDNLVWSPDGRTIAFTSEVYVDCREETCNGKRDEDREKSPVRARIYDRLLYRHWNSWSEGKRSHLFLVSAAGGAPRDLIPGADYDVPPREREGPHPIAFAPDNQWLCFTAVTDGVEAISTNGDLFEVDVKGGTPKRLTDNPGFDGAPAYSPDGRTIAYRSQVRAGYEADKWRLMLYDRSSRRHRSLTDAFDRSVESPLWSSDGQSIYFNAEDRGEMPLFVLPASGGTPRALTPGTHVSEFDIRGPSDVVVLSSSRLDSPAELYSMPTTCGAKPCPTFDFGMAVPLTHHNQHLLSELDLAKPESFTFTGAGETEVQGFVIRPPAFDPSKKYPVLLLLHGGPQTQWSDAWSYRWNAQAFAASGSLVVLINRRGSTGFGQKFTDDITLDWGGKPLEDLMKGLDFVLSKYPFADSQRVGAAGASYGGYMINWLASHGKGRFRVLVSHAGVYDLTSMYATEELWFPEHDFGGTPWTNPAVHEKLSPHTYAADFGKYKTPTLVVCGEQDYRVPYTQSLEFFSALQRQDVPSKLIVFPDEGHWILKPQNSSLWYKEVLGWLQKYLN